jgi:MFS family permease
MTPRAVAALGFGQCVNWGVLYYAFAILVVPLERELGVATWAITGAFSLALLVSAGLAPVVGRLADRGYAPLMMQSSGVAAAVLLAMWTLSPSVQMLYLVWAGLGACMAATLYEPAFVIVGRAFHDSTARLRALAAVTLFGGLASTIFLPATALLVESSGWRGAVLVLAGALLVSALVMRLFVFRDTAARIERPFVNSPALVGIPPAPDRTSFLFVVGAVALASLASAGFAANLLPVLGERGISPGQAAFLGGCMGVMQLPGRLLLMNGAFAGVPARLLAVTLILHGIGLAMVAAAPSLLGVAAGALIFALGGGLTTLVRPHLIQTLFDTESAGYWNGRLARHQQVARAAGPLTIAWFGSALGYAPVFLIIAALFMVFALASDVRLSCAPESLRSSEPI